MIGVCKICSKLFETTTEEAFSPDCTCVQCWRKAHGLPVEQPRPALSAWYMGKAQKWAEEAEARRDAWCDGQAIRWAQDHSAVYATLARQAAARYGAVQP